MISKISLLYQCHYSRVSLIRPPWKDKSKCWITEAVTNSTIVHIVLHFSTLGILNVDLGCM